MTTDSAILGAVITKLREQRNPPMAQHALAVIMGLSPSAWSRVEKGDTELSASQLRLLSKTLETSPDQLFSLADQIQSGLESKGVSVQPKGIWKELSNSKVASASGAAIAGIAAAGVLPVVGPALLGMVGGLILKKFIEKEKS